MNYWKLGCRWGKRSEGKPLFFDLLIKENIVISWNHLDFGKDAIVLLTDGFTPLGIAKTLSKKRPIQELIDKESDFKEKQIYFEEGLVYYDATIILIQNPNFSYDAQQGIINIHSNQVIKNIQRIMNAFDKNVQLETTTKLLEYKKQIILQGPPGTGKTRLAKELAELLILPNKKIDIEYFKSAVKTLKIFQSRINYNSLTIESFSGDIIFFEGTASVPKYNFSLADLYYCYTSNDYQGTDFVPYPQYAKRSLVWFIIDTFRDTLITDQCKLIQFHPSYTYEDFVRGIVAKPNPDGEGVVYEAENKTLGAFAKKAMDNFVNSTKDAIVISEEIKIKQLFDNFVEHLNDEIENADGFYSLTDNVGLISTDDENAFRYKGKNDGWLKNGNRILFKDILQSYLVGDSVRKDIKKNDKISGLARQHASYFVCVLNLFQEFIKKEKLDNNSITNIEKVELKNFILIIDEINRANLSSVLGELIYALEYRGEAVESMYNVDGNELILPPNLYIIGTMNTADRSVGHIDYAIRRRFAFVDVPPENLKVKQGLENFSEALFLAVEKIFQEHTSPEFEVNDVQLGHSYFIDKSNEENGVGMDIRFEYEIKPILLEYVKDGVLIETDIKKKIEELKVHI